MVVNEKGLLKAMKDAYKTDGYTVAVDEADLILKTVTWTVVLHMEEVPSKVLALITEHLRKLPDPGTAYQVKKKETQTEIFRMVKEEILNFHTSENFLCTVALSASGTRAVCSQHAFSLYLIVHQLLHIRCCTDALRFEYGVITAQIPRKVSRIECFLYFPGGRWGNLSNQDEYGTGRHLGY